MTRKLSVLLVLLILACGSLGYGWVIGNWWPDGDDIIMDDVLLPADPWSVPAQSQAKGDKHLPQWTLEVLDEEDGVVATVLKTLYVRRKRNAH